MNPCHLFRAVQTTGSIGRACALAMDALDALLEEYGFEILGLDVVGNEGLRWRVRDGLVESACTDESCKRLHAVGRVKGGVQRSDGIALVRVHYDDETEDVAMLFEERLETP